MADPASPSGRATVPVSVVVPCFGCGETIGRAVASVAAQTWLPLEVILVDDGNRDRTATVLREIQRRYGAEWVRIISLPENLGAASARNAGWDAATGEWIAFLDADDSWYPRKIEIQSRWMRAHPAVAVCGHLSRLAGQDQGEEAIPAEAHARAITRNMLLLSNRFVTPSAMLRREIGVRFRAGERHMEDHLLWMEIALSGMPIARLEHVLCYTHKAAYGERGLSADMWKMERAELGNYRHLGERGLISKPTALALQFLSFFKYVRRLLLKALGRLPESA